MELREIENHENHIHLYHLKLTGSDREIGYELGQLARETHRINKKSRVSAQVLKAQVDYLKQYYPQHHDRMQGFAAAYDQSLYDTSHDFSCFGRPLGETACSAVFYPPALTRKHHGHISRNLDFPIPADYRNLDTFPFKHTYLVEMRPDNSYASLSLFCFDIFGLALEGINERGLAVIHLADADTRHDHGASATGRTRTGFNEFLPIQYLLDNCETVAEARAALEQMTHYHAAVPVHLLVADQKGNAVVFEYAPDGKEKVFVQGESDTPLRITNFQLNRLDNPALLAEMETRASENGMDRYQWLGQVMETTPFPVDEETIRHINGQVYVHSDGEDQLDRTLFHTVYDLSACTVRIRLLPSTDLSVDAFATFDLLSERKQD